MTARYRFGDFELDVTELELRREGKPVALQELPLRLLAQLIEQAPATVSRESLQKSLWPPGTHLDVNASLNTAVARIREALEDPASAPQFVATVPRRGYRFVAPVATLAVRAEPGTLPLRKQARLLVPSLGILAAFSVLAAGYWIGGSRERDQSGGGQTSLSSDASRQHLQIARHHAEKRSHEGLEKAIASFQSAVAADPTNAEAYAGLASSYSLLGIYDYWRPRDAYAPAETMARRALELDDRSAEAHLASGVLSGVAHWQWDEGLASIERAVELAPDSAEMHYWLGVVSSCLGRHEQALASSRRAIELDPTSPVINASLAWQLFQAGQGEEAIAQAHRAIELDPNYYDSWDNLKWIELTIGHEVPAVEAWVRAEELGSANGQGVRDAYDSGGLEGLHRASIESQLANWRTGTYQPPYDIALEYAALGEVESALLWLERSFAERETDLVALAVDPRLQRLHREPGFVDLVNRLGLPSIQR